MPDTAHRPDHLIVIADHIPGSVVGLEPGMASEKSGYGVEVIANSSDGGHWVVAGQHGGEPIVVGDCVGAKNCGSFLDRRGADLLPVEWSQHDGLVCAVSWSDDDELSAVNTDVTPEVMVGVPPKGFGR